MLKNNKNPRLLAVFYQSKCKGTMTYFWRWFIMGKSDIFYMIICDRKLLGTPCIVFQHLSSGYYQFCLQCKIPLDSVLWLWNCRVKFLTIVSLAIEFCVKLFIPLTYVENSWEEGNLDSSFCSASNICIVDLSFSDFCLKCSISVVWF